MVGFPKVIKTKADLVNTYKLVKKGRLKKEDWLAAVEKLENQNFIFCPILEKTGRYPYVCKRGYRGGQGKSRERDRNR